MSRHLATNSAVIQLLTVSSAKLGQRAYQVAVWSGPNFGHMVEERADYSFGSGGEQFAYGAGYSPKISCMPYPELTYEQCAVDKVMSYGNTLCDYGKLVESATPLCGYYETAGGTILGDLRVSKFLIDRAYERAGITDKECVAFRPGHLKYPARMDEALEATGFKYVSVTEANEVTSHLYFQKNYQGTNLTGSNTAASTYAIPFA